MRPHRTRAPQPTPAERVQSILQAAQSMTVVSDGHNAEVNRLGGSGAMGHIHLHPPSEDAPATSHTRLPVRLELTDIAPTVVRDRLRARVTLTGLLAAPYSNDSTKSTCMEFGQAVLEDSRGRHFVSLDELWAAGPAPIAVNEAELLTHLVDSHGGLVALLVRLVQPRPTRDMLRAVPLAMDRYGVTLRLEYPATHHDVRLPFATPVSSMEQAGPQIRSLLATARRTSHRNRLLTIHER
ncbi:DUF2470 domain-containing protein [Streptomyces sp. A5-4]|uniref:DUF2470 domain-containing protein n=1 Tax=Streptomyces sp. A5-4 TaxID=3384771 RepID=UPI003DA9610C